MYKYRLYIKVEGCMRFVAIKVDIIAIPTETKVYNRLILLKDRPT